LSLTKIRKSIAIKAALRETEDSNCPQRRICSKKPKQYLSEWWNDYKIDPAEPESDWKGCFKRNGKESQQACSVCSR
jgi:hypothetical protein